MGRLQAPNNYHSAALCAFTNLINMMHFRATVLPLAMNYFNVTKKSKFITPFFLRAHIPHDLNMLSCLFRLFLIKIFFIGGHFIPVFLS